MRLQPVLVACIALSTALPGLAAAAPANKAGVEEGARAVPKAAGQTRELIYDDEELTGESLLPDHERVDFRPPGKHPSLIQVRAHFIPQLLRMATDV
ncbi:MAG: hypothetical protein JNK56_01050 [Myxococcales bacterium]|nr:hypothetical protein [Myxococcales bacterium]